MGPLRALIDMQYVCFMSIDDDLGVEREAVLSGGRIRYRERGAGPPVVFVHGLLANANLWRGVVPGLAASGLRCLAPDWPFGAHTVPVPDADLSPPGAAALIGEFLDRLDLHEVTLVANDTGGAIVQILMASRPERVARVVLTPSDSFERFFPPLFGYLPWLARVPGFVELLLRVVAVPAVARLPFTFGGLAGTRLPDDLIASVTAPGRRDRAVRDDLRRFLRGVHRRHTLAAVEELPRFDRSVLLAWATDDRIFPISLAHRLAERLPRARIVAISGSRTFVPIDRPDRLTEEIREFLRAERVLTRAAQPG